LLSPSYIIVLWTRTKALALTRVNHIWRNTYLGLSNTGTFPNILGHILSGQAMRTLVFPWFTHTQVHVYMRWSYYLMAFIWLKLLRVSCLTHCVTLKQKYFIILKLCWWRNISILWCVIMSTGHTRPTHNYIYNIVVPSSLWYSLSLHRNTCIVL